MGDYISKKALLEKLKYMGDYNIDIDYVTEEDIMSVPCADVRENIHGRWERMSDLPEDKDDRYKCSRCGNVVHHSNGVNLYTFNSWCGACGSLNNSLLASFGKRGIND